MNNVKTKRVTIETHPAIYDTQFIKDQITQYNNTKAGIHDGKSLAIFLRNRHGEIFAGIFGWTWGGCCEIEYLWVHEDMRRQGLGTRLLSEFEREAVDRGCYQISLHTYSFQAPKFYQKHGYQVLFVLDNCPRNHKQYYLIRRISDNA